ncbi:signal peptide peptidase SppA [Marinomonas algicola]|uniref:signal peptide peptidase SppA n=1 Tax=Marinomonas algicola TaxID=2773454 RepID=UPI00174A6CC4|nr:signal peptide peptidase SppA [Marinomonas algicola]
MSWTEEEDSVKGQMELLEDDGRSKISPKSKGESDTGRSVYALLEKVLSENVQEKRRARRWKIFFRFAFLALFAVAIFVTFNQVDYSESAISKPFVAVLPLTGVIGSGEQIDSDVVVKLLNEAYEESKLHGVVLRLNSPGGSPVHSGIIYDAIKEKKLSHPAVPVIVVVEDMAASGGYYIASAADEIYVDKASLLGSIGVISSGFDLSGLIEKIGVQRRTFTSGENKAFMDPFVPMTEEAKAKWQAVLDETHQQFITAVKDGRGARLKETQDVFSGMVFSGAQSVNMGLSDGLMSFHKVLDSKFEGVDVVYFEPRKEPWEEFAKSIGVGVILELVSTVKMH